ncbi:hypothetical protein ACS212_22835, partial [Escherichia coli]|uniref:hypothetical protein n=1 Tax=Escherichia coli TaxID=562 RepID=UPI003F288C44
FTQAIDAISKQLTNMLREIENNQQAGKRTMTLDGPQVSGAGNKAMPYQPDGTRTPAPTPPPAAAA